MPTLPAAHEELADSTPVKKKNWLKDAFINAAVGGITAYAVKTCMFAALCTVATTPLAALAVTVFTAMAAGAVSGGVRHGINKLRGKENGKTLTENMVAGTAWSGLFGMAFGGIFTFDGIADEIKLLFSDGPADAIQEAVSVEAPIPQSLPVPPPEMIVEPETDPLAELKGISAQQIKDEAVRLFNDSNPGNDGYAVELFNRAAEMGNYSAQIDKAYIEHWGLAGVPKDDFGSIERLNNTLLEMKKAGIADNPHSSYRPEYERGFKLFEEWLGITPAVQMNLGAPQVP